MVAEPDARSPSVAFLSVSLAVLANAELLQTNAVLNTAFTLSRR